MSLKRNYNLILLFALLLIVLLMMVLPSNIAYAEPVINNNAYLKSLEVVGYNIKFDKDTFLYKLTIPNSVTRLNLKYLAENPDATCEVIGNSYLEVGTSQIAVVVTATDNVAQKTYTIEVFRRDDSFVESGNNKLIKLQVEGYKLDPRFEQNVFEYKVTVPFNVDKVNIIYEAQETDASVILSGPEKLVAGKNQYIIQVKAPNGNTQDYKIEVTRTQQREKSTNNNLRSLSVEGFKLKEEFKNNILEYNVDVLDTTKEVNIIAEPEDSYSIVQIVGGKDLKMGLNEVQVAVTSEVGETKIYLIKINRPIGNDNNYLSSLSIDGYNMTPTFNKEILEYRIRIKYTQQEVKVRYTTEDKGAKVLEYGGLNLAAEKDNYVYLVVKAPNNDERKYKITLVYSEETDAIDEESKDSTPVIKPGSVIPGGTTLGMPSWQLGIILAVLILVIAVVSSLIATFVPRKYKIKKDKPKKDKSEKTKQKKNKVEKDKTIQEENIENIDDTEDNNIEENQDK